MVMVQFGFLPEPNHEQAYTWVLSREFVKIESEIMNKTRGAKDTSNLE
jgi:hypothetical protein